jgi:hypothetical protein
MLPGNFTQSSSHNNLHPHEMVSIFRTVNTENLCLQKGKGHWI